jgi:hypothetical protein
MKERGGARGRRRRFFFAGWRMGLLACGYGRSRLNMLPVVERVATGLVWY